MARHVACGLWPVTMAGARAAGRCARRSVIVPIQPVSVRQSFRSIPGCRLLGGPVAGTFPASRPSSATLARTESSASHLLRGRMLLHWPMPLQHECCPSQVGDVVAPVNESSTHAQLGLPTHGWGDAERNENDFCFGTWYTALAADRPRGTARLLLCMQRCRSVFARTRRLTASKLVLVQRCIHHPRRLLVLTRRSEACRQQQNTSSANAM